MYHLYAGNGDFVGVAHTFALAWSWENSGGGRRWEYIDPTPTLGGEGTEYADEPPPTVAAPAATR